MAPMVRRKTSRMPFHPNLNAILIGVCCFPTSPRPLASSKTGDSLSWRRNQYAATVTKIDDRNTRRQPHELTFSSGRSCTRIHTSAPSTIERRLRRTPSRLAAALVAWGALGEQHDAAGLFGAGAETLQYAAQHQQDRTPDSCGGVGGQQADREGCGAHQEQGGHQHELASDPIAVVGEEEPTDGAGDKADSVSRERGEDALWRGLVGKEDLVEDQCGAGAVDHEVVVLKGGAHQAGHRRSSQRQLVDGDVLADGIVRHRCGNGMRHAGLRDFRPPPDLQRQGALKSSPTNRNCSRDGRNSCGICTRSREPAAKPEKPGGCRSVRSVRWGTWS